MDNKKTPPKDKVPKDKGPQDSSPQDKETHFGFRQVQTEEKAGLVQDVFTSVAGKYDVMNDLMSLGVHRLWKRAFLRKLAPRVGESFLDVAGGTGDISFGIAKALKKRNFEKESYQEEQEGQSSIEENALNAVPKERTSLAEKPKKSTLTLCDLTESMLSVGQKRPETQSISQEKHISLDWVCGNAQTLPFPDQSFDAYTISFGLRNVTDIDQGLAEAYRVLKRGGRFFCLEFSTVTLPLFDEIYERYSFSALPWLGEKIAKDRESYLYLAESIRQFPTQENLKKKMEAAGFKQVHYQNFSGGIAAMHWGWKT